MLYCFAEKDMFDAVYAVIAVLGLVCDYLRVLRETYGASFVLID